MNNKIIKKISALMLLGAVTIPTAVHARSIGEFEHYKITTAEKTSSYLTKTIDNDKSGGRYVFNFESTSSGDSSAGVKHRLVNSGGARRSDDGITKDGERKLYSNEGQAGYIYALVTESGDLFDKDFYIDASWSPDEK